MGGDTPSQFVVLVRHGDAVGEEDDPRRPLSASGRSQVAKVGGLVAGLGLQVDEIRHSGKARARETAELFAEQLGVAAEVVGEVSGLGPKDDVEAIAEELEASNRSRALVGHLPFMKLLASRLLCGDSTRLDVRFGDAACLVAARVVGGWRLEALINHPLQD